MDRNSISIAGEFAVLSHLLLNGFDTNLTLGNTKSVDILASHPQSGKMYKIEVKTSFSSNKGVTRTHLFGTTFGKWILNKKNESITDANLFYCFVLINKDTHNMRYFIVPSKVVAHHIKNSHAHWLQSDQSHKDTDMRNFFFGVKKEECLIKNTPLVADYENNWKF